MRLGLRPSATSGEHGPGRELDRSLLGACGPGTTRRWAHTRGVARLATAAVIETAAPAIEIDRLRTRHGDASVLEDITLTVCRQEIFGLLGLNGAGKTSLLKSILMLATPQAGAVRLFGE